MQTAILASALPLAGNGIGQVQLLPAGEFVARDGRPGNGLRWRVSDARGRQLATQLNVTAAATPIVIDYDHQTLSAQDKGVRAPAAGWMKDFAWRPGVGLFASVVWTAAAAAHIAAREYQYISPVITYDKVSGEVTSLLLAALVNMPALLGMAPVLAALAANWGAVGSPESGAATWAASPALRAVERLGGFEPGELAVMRATQLAGNCSQQQLADFVVAFGVTPGQVLGTSPVMPQTAPYGTPPGGDVSPEFHKIAAAFGFEPGELALTRATQLAGRCSPQERADFVAAFGLAPELVQQQRA